MAAIFVALHHAFVYVCAHTAKCFVLPFSERGPGLSTRNELAVIQDNKELYNQRPWTVSKYSCTVEDKIEAPACIVRSVKLSYTD